MHTPTPEVVKLDVDLKINIRAVTSSFTTSGVRVCTKVSPCVVLQSKLPRFGVYLEDNGVIVVVFGEYGPCGFETIVTILYVYRVYGLKVSRTSSNKLAT